MQKLKGILGALAIGITAWLPATALADPPPWAPAHGYRAVQHRYIYYPRHQVYYEPQRHAWFWLDDGRWRFGASLPSGMMQVAGPGVSVVLGTALPYEEHVYVVERYGFRGDGHHREHRRHRHHRRRHHHDDD